MRSTLHTSLRVGLPQYSFASKQNKVTFSMAVSWRVSLSDIVSICSILSASMRSWKKERKLEQESHSTPKTFASCALGEHECLPCAFTTSLFAILYSCQCMDSCIFSYAKLHVYIGYIPFTWSKVQNWLLLLAILPTHSFLLMCIIYDACRGTRAPHFAKQVEHTCDLTPCMALAACSRKPCVPQCAMEEMCM